MILLIGLLLLGIVGVGVALGWMLGAVGLLIWAIAVVVLSAGALLVD